MNCLKAIPFGSVVLLGAAGLSACYMDIQTIMPAIASWSFLVLSFYPLIFEEN